MVEADLKLLNVGCGRHFHPAWRNLDVVSWDPAVEACDLRQGLPVADQHCDMVYHSHVLEHLPPEDGQALIRECHRVLKSGGLLRVVVPDLEQIARLYLQCLEEAWQGAVDGETRSQADNVGQLANDRYQWMKLELLDQMVRRRSGGRMGPFLQAARGPLVDFIRSRLGREVDYILAPADKDPADKDPADENRGAVGGDPPAPVSGQPVENRPPWKRRWARRVLKWLMGKRAVEHWAAGEFMDSGEVHCWMYDRWSLRELCLGQGFVEFQVCQSHESRLPGFAGYHLDQIDGQPRKPDSLFVECRKP